MENRTRNPGSRGQVLVLVALALFVLMGFAAIGIDVGYMYSVRHELQRCADTGALAGASAFFDGDWASSNIRAEADVRARDYASRDAVSTTALDPGSEVSVSFPVQDRIRVDTQRTVNLFFARVLGMPTRNITAYAIAEAKLVDQQLPCIKPWGIPLPWADDGDGIYEPGIDGAPSMDCPVPGDPNAFCQGTRIILKIGTPSGQPNQPDIPSIQQEAGHFFALDFGSGAQTYREMIKAGCPDNTVASVGDYIPLEPGNMVGPTVQAVTTDTDSLINQDPNSHWVDTPDGGLPTNDTNFLISDGSWMASPRVLRIPVYDPTDALSTGKTEMRIAGFAGFWVESADRSANQGTVYGRYIPMTAFGGTSGASPGPNPGPVLRMLRLVE